MESWKTFTSESVSEGHPDKVADQISDAILDHCLRHDPQSRVACETLVTTDLVILAGEVTTQAGMDKATAGAIARETIADIGYVHKDVGFAAESCEIGYHIHQQSPDIARGVNVGGASDQGMMFGFAADETDGMMPAPIFLSHRLMEAHATMRKSGEIGFLRPDAKAQVTVAYRDDGTPHHVAKIVLSTQHDQTAITGKGANAAFSEAARQIIIDQLIQPTLRLHGSHLLRGSLVAVCPGKQAPVSEDLVPCFVNQTGMFLQGGPHGDCGVTGRKIIVDTYGGIARHGGGAFSGKDPTKVDRSAAYLCRAIAKHIVSAGMAQRCEVRIAYVIGRDEPVDFAVETFGSATNGISDNAMATRLAKAIDMRPASIIELLSLRQPMYRRTAAYGHFGRDGFPWEEIRPEILEVLRKV